MNEKVLILGATGTMGHYLTEKLAADVARWTRFRWIA